MNQALDLKSQKYRVDIYVGGKLFKVFTNISGTSRDDARKNVMDTDSYREAAGWARDIDEVVAWDAVES